MQELLTVQQFAEAAGITKQAVYKAFNNKLKDYYQLVDGKKMVQSKALHDVYGVTVEQKDNQPLNNQRQPLETLIEILQKEIDVKNGQIESLQRQNEQLTSALSAAQETARAAQALHAGTLQQQLDAPSDETVVTTVQEKKKGFFSWIRKR